jgi:hypothetical protein
MALFQVGRQIEIYGDPDQGFAESWAVAKVVEIKENPSGIIPNLVVHYNEVRAHIVIKAFIRAAAGGHQLLRHLLVLSSCGGASLNHAAPTALQFVDEDGNPEREEHNARSIRIRPAWPAAANPTSLSAYEVRGP